MKTGIIIVAGGKGTRMGNAVPKQFMLLNGRPVLMHTIEKFRSALPDAHIVAVLPKEDTGRWAQLVKEFDFNIAHRVTTGGKNRFESVKNGIKSLPECDYIGVHDGVRPLVPEEVISRVLKDAVTGGAAIPVVKISDSLREVGSGNSRIVDRGKFVAVQTPQFFRSEILNSAYQTDFSDSFTDDASVVESQGHKITLSEGDTSNIKITTPVDLAIAEILISDCRQE